MRGLFIGIGGTGDEILVRLKDKVYASTGDIPKTLQFRLIDTEAPEYRKNMGARQGGKSSKAFIDTDEYLQLEDSPPPNSLADITKKVDENDAAFPEISRWYRADLFQKLPKANLSLVRGAGQYRQIARMGIFLNKGRLINLLTHAMKECDGEGGELLIWIIGSVAGGTGAGIFMDLALLSRMVAEKLHLRYRIIGAAVLPDVYKDVNTDDTSAWAVIRELERFQSSVPAVYRGRINHNQVGICYSVEYDSVTRVNLTDQLFDSLVFYNRDCSSNDERDFFFSEVADGLNLLLDEAVGSEFFSRLINANRAADSVDGLSRDRATSFGTHRIFVPIQLYERQFVLDAALAVANGLLPRDPSSQVLDVGSSDDRRRDAERILGEELFAVFRILNKPANEKERKDLSDRMNSSYIVNHMLGFTNPSMVFGQAIGEDKEHAARRLFDDIFGDIKTVREIKEDFEDSKTRLKAEVVTRRRDYEGDGVSSFSASLAAIRSLVEEQVRVSIDNSARKYLGSLSAQEQALGRTNRVYTELMRSLADVRANLEQIVADDRAALETAKERENEALVTMQRLEKKLLGWRGPLADAEEVYLSAVNQVNQCIQRERLVVFLRELILVADAHLTRWQEGIQGWQDAILRVVGDAKNEGSEIAERLDRQVRGKSASMGLKNTVEMDGYREALRRNCLLDSKTGKSFVEDLLHMLKWKPGADPVDLALEWWPTKSLIEARDFPKTLFTYLSGRIGERMREFEGMTNYLKWLRNEKRGDGKDLTKELLKVTGRDRFVDGRSESDSRTVLFLYGDIWNSDHDGQSTFTQVYSLLNQDDHMAGKVVDGLKKDGINLFKDRNVMAVLIYDTNIPYRQIHAIQQMQDAYINFRHEKHPAESLAETHHLFRCDQEAWRIEHAQTVDTRSADFPQIPGMFARLLDDPNRVELFAKSLVTGVVRAQTMLSGLPIWVCGSVMEQDPKKLFFLNDPDDSKDKRDLLRALVTFVMDRGDRRRGITGTLDPRRIDGWITEQLNAHGKNLAEMAKSYREENPKRFEIGEKSEIDEDAFFALILNHYLKLDLGTHR
jgi:hypothetical protein